MNTATVQKEKVPISQIQFGMFIAELDRPWLKSPFLLQGFVLNTDEQMAALKDLCEFVFVDRTKSVGVQFNAKAKVDVAIKRDGSVNRVRATSVKRITTKSRPTVVVKTKGNKNKTIKESSFFEVMNAIRKGEVEHTKDGVIFNVSAQTDSHTNDANADSSSEQENKVNETQSGGIGFLKGLFSSKDKLKSSVKYEGKDDKRDEKDNPERFRVTIYEDEVPNVEEEIAVIYPTYEKSQVATKELFEAIADDQNLDLSTVSDVLDNMVDSISRTPDALMWLSKLKDTDDVAYGQALNVSINMMAFASFLALPKQNIKDMGMAGLLQDIGKVKIPDRILHKPSRLNARELEVAKLHVEEGIKILEQTDDVSAYVMETVLQHHERFNGTGYPNQLKDQQISLNGQAAGLIDTYCAMTSDRVYANGLHNQEALDAIHRMRDVAFSDELIDQLIQFLGMYPVSSLVELNTGEVGVVIQQNQVRRLQPRVMIVLTPEKIKYTAPITIDLLNAPLTPSGEPYKIEKGIPSDSYGLNLSDFFE